MTPPYFGPTQPLLQFFYNQSWDLAFESCNLHALSSSDSYHCPLPLTNKIGPRRARPFKFKNFWSCLPHFEEKVAEAWNAPTTHTKSFHRLGHKLHHTAKVFESWASSFLSETRQQRHMAQEVILRLDEAQEFRQLSDVEFTLRAKLKKRILGWLVVEKARKKQCARIAYIKEGDANTCFFHLRANSRRRKNYINACVQGRVGSSIITTNIILYRTTSKASWRTHRCASVTSIGLPFNSKHLTYLPWTGLSPRRRSDK